MVGGIDLSMAAAISLLANILVGVSKGADDRLGLAVSSVLCWAVVIGLVNGLLVAVARTQPAHRHAVDGASILLGITAEYRSASPTTPRCPSRCRLRLRQGARHQQAVLARPRSDVGRLSWCCGRRCPDAASSPSAPTAGPPGWPASTCGPTSSSRTSARPSPPGSPGSSRRDRGQAQASIPVRPTSSARSPQSCSAAPRCRAGWPARASTWVAAFFVTFSTRC